MLEQVLVLSQVRRVGNLFNGIAFFDPVGGEAGGENEDAKVAKAHAVQGGESRAEVGAAVKRAAAAVNDEVCVLRESGGEFLEVGDAFFFGAGAVEDSARDVSTRVEGSNADVDDLEGRIFFLEFFGEAGRRDSLVRVPGIGLRRQGASSGHEKK